MNIPEMIHSTLTRWLKTSWLGTHELIYEEQLYIEALNDFRADYARWYPLDDEIDLLHLEMVPQLHPVLTYRLAHRWWKTNEDQALLLSNLGRINGQCEIFYSSEIGPGLKIYHGIGSVIGARCKIGANCTIHQGVTLGDRNGLRPTIGDDCWLYAHSLILGDITLGNRCVVSANAVVMQSAPDDSLLVGTPAKIIRKRNPI